MASILRLSLLCALVLLASAIPVPPRANPAAKLPLLRTATQPDVGPLPRDGPVIHRFGASRLLSSKRSAFRKAFGTTRYPLVHNTDFRKVGAHDKPVDKSDLFKRFASGHVTNNALLGRDAQLSNPRLLKMKLSAAHEVNQANYSQKKLSPAARDNTGKHALLRAVATRYVRTKKPRFPRSSEANKLNTARIAVRMRTPNNAMPVLTRVGLTGDICSSDSECATGRTCLLLDDSAEACPGGASSCRLCVPPVLEDCTSSTNCSTTGEVCAEAGTGESVCVSADFAEACDICAVVDDGVSDGSGETPETSPPPPSGGGLTGDLCSSDSECATGRTCLLLADDSARLCLPPVEEECTSSTNCSTTGEVCAGVGTGENFCVSAQFAEDNAWTVV